jgi:hypothetical protein
MYGVEFVLSKIVKKIVHKSVWKFLCVFWTEIFSYFTIKVTEIASISKNLSMMYCA